ncbi:MAG: nuclear transport factor 2 family protein [Desulfobacterales bacterium]|nr:nuclear transport factor 2 family protein [Desulfobacterales bacterium]
MTTFFILSLSWFLLGSGFAANLPADETGDIKAIISVWRDTWQNKDMGRYRSFYSPNFSAGAHNYQTWMQHKTMLFKRPGKIFIQLSNLKVEPGGNSATVTFVQFYQSPAHSDMGEKKLILEKSEGAWKINFEQWKPLSKDARVIQDQAEILWIIHTF